MDMPVETATQVVIVGGGPVGLGLAIDLGQRGVSCILVERYVSPQPIPKGQNLTQRTLEHFYFWGAEAELRAARTIPPNYGIGGMTSYGTLLSGYRYSSYPDRPRAADGAVGIPLDRPAQIAGALSQQVLLQRAASRLAGLLEVLRPRRSRHHLVLPRAGAARHHERQFRFPWNAA